MNEQIGSVAGTIWRVLEAKGEMSLAQVKKEVKSKPPLFDWALGWLAREDKILITADKRSFTIRLK